MMLGCAFATVGTSVLLQLTSAILDDTDADSSDMFVALTAIFSESVFRPVEDAVR